MGFLTWACSNQDVLGPFLAVVLPASILSGFRDKLPAWALHLTNIVGLNWGDTARALLAAFTASKQPPALTQAPSVTVDTLEKTENK